MPRFITWLVGMIYLYVCTFMFVLPWVCQDLGYSLYYKPSKHTAERLEKINNARTMEAKGFLSKTLRLERKEANLRDLQGDLRFAFIIVTVHRPSDPHYLLQVVSRLLAQGLREDAVRTKIIVLNADLNPSDNQDAELLSDYVTVLNLQTILNNTNKYFTADNVFEKEKEDYAVALKIGIQLSASYTVIIEDDALPDNHLIRKLQLIVGQKIPGNYRKSHSDWAFLKLYYPEKWQGYGNSEIHELVCIFLLGSFVPVYIQMKLQRIRGLQIIFLFFAWGIYFTGIAYGIGRAHLVELRRLLPLFYTVAKAPGCCTPAVLYQRSFLRELVGFLASKKCSKTYPIDFALDDFAHNLGLQNLLVTPNLFTHIGFHSSLHTSPKELKEFNLMLDP